MVTGTLRVRGGTRGRGVRALVAGAVLVAVLPAGGRGVVVAVAGRAHGPAGMAPARRRKPAPTTWPQLATAASGASAAPRASVGPLFYPGGGHQCTASVVAGPGGDLLVTAAHCVYGGGGYRSGLRFAPGYIAGRSPEGVWQVVAVFVDSRWIGSADPDDDVAFLRVRPLNGRTVEQVSGAHALGVGYGPVNQVTVTGYPADGDRPLSCGGPTAGESATQMRFDCDGFTSGTSGGPWVTGDGSVIGVIGGHHAGGYLPSVSYSPRFGDQVKALYDTAIGAS
jgi:V8-like Glu-specific endopeptidase